MTDNTTLRANIAFALNLADSLGVTVQTLSADVFSNVTLYAWAMGFPAIAEIADREGWPSEVNSGAGWQDRCQTFDIEGHKIRITLVGDGPAVAA